MKLMFVRHAEPWYAIDSLTAKGHREAALLAERMAKVDTTAYYVSPLGRARETARYTLEKVGREAEVLPWLAEFRGKYFDPDCGHHRIPWDIKPSVWLPHEKLREAEGWVDDPLMADGDAAAIWEETKAGLDELLGRYGFQRDGRIWRCPDNRPDTLVLFCHFGIMTACIAYLLGMSPVAMWHGFCTQPSSVTTLVTEERVKGECVWRCMQLGDISHLYAGNEPYSTAALFPECYTGRDSTNPPEWKELGYE